MTSDVYEHYVKCYFQFYLTEYENSLEYIHKLLLNDNKKIYIYKQTALPTNF
jgi:hypothetical protein